MPCRVDTALRRVRRQLRERMPFEDIEAAIERMPGLDDDEKAVLWLYAWCEGCVKDLRSIVMAGEERETTA